MVDCTIAAFGFANKKFENLFCCDCKCAISKRSADMTPDEDLIQQFENNWNDVAITFYSETRIRATR
jgi:hypothetical protein